MKRLLVGTVVLGVLGAHCANTLFAQEGRRPANKPENTGNCACLIEELFDLGSYSLYDATRYDEGNCANVDCGDFTPVSWLGRENWPQDCEDDLPHPCMSNQLVVEKDRSHALKEPRSVLYDPVRSGDIVAKGAEICHSEIIHMTRPRDNEKTRPVVDDVITVKVFLILLPKRDVPIERAAKVVALGVEVDPVENVRTADGTVRDAEFPNLYHVAIGRTTYRVVTTAQESDKD